MKKIFVADQKAAQLTDSFNAIAKEGGIAARFEAYTSISAMLESMHLSSPDLVLLHHHWDGMTISQIVGRLAQANATTRVIVFTGQSLNAAELIECVRSGAADYWDRRGSRTDEWMFDQIIHYCSSEAWTVRALKMPSGSIQKLIGDAEVLSKDSERLHGENRELRVRVKDLEASERRKAMKEMLSVVRFAAYAAIMLVFFGLAGSLKDVAVWQAGALTVLLAVLYLFAERKLTTLRFRSGENGSDLEMKS